MTRVTPGMTASDSANTIVLNDGPTDCTMMSSSSSAGNAIAVSTARWINESIRPPK